MTCTNSTCRPAKRHSCARTRSEIAGWDFDHDGNLRLAERTNQAGDTEILRVDPDGFKQIYSCSVLEGCGVEGFDAANKQVYLITNKGDARSDANWRCWILATGATTKIGERSGESRRYRWVCRPRTSTTTSASPQYEDDRDRLYFRDKAFEKEYRLAAVETAGHGDQLRRPLRDENIWIVMRQQRRGAGRDLCLESQGEDADAAVPDPRRAAARRRSRSASPITSNRRTGWRFRPI